MMFQKRVDRAMAHAHEQAAKRQQAYDPKAEQEERPLKDFMEKGDIPALVLSALFIIVPVALVALLVVVGFGVLPFLFS